MYTFCSTAAAQQVAFSRLHSINVNAIALTAAAGGNHYWVAWKENTAVSEIKLAGFENSGSTDTSISTLHFNNETINQMQLAVLGNQLYLFWLNDKGSLKYAILQTGGRDVHTSYTLANNVWKHPVAHFSISNDSNGLLLAVITNNAIEFAPLSSNADKTLSVAEKFSITNFRHGQIHSFEMTAVNDQQLGIAWKEAGNSHVFYATTARGAAKQITSVRTVESAVAPSLGGFAAGIEHPYIFGTGKKKDYQLGYTYLHTDTTHGLYNRMPLYFASKHKIALAGMRGNRQSILAFINLKNQICIAAITYYNPERWMEEILAPAKGNFSLRDIVMPGSHDAGMSVLTATGGQQKGTINECNTLTQQLTIEKQLAAGVRMFDLRISMLNKLLYLKHASSDCMEDAIGGGYGERFSVVMQAIKNFMHRNTKETILLTFAHFCPKEIPVENVADSVVACLGEDIIFKNENNDLIGNIPLSRLFNKVIIANEDFEGKKQWIDLCTVKDSSASTINFRRMYAATNKFPKLLSRQQQFFSDVNSYSSSNDLVRLDWQLTQAAPEAGFICNDFESEAINPFISAFLWATIKIKNYRSITRLAMYGNQWLVPQVNSWIDSKTIVRKNKPNILYVDVASAWITDYCVGMNIHEEIYQGTIK